MANPQPDKFTKLSNELFEAIMTTDFTKRQRNILDFVIRMSYGCGKKAALLRPSDFELVGVRKGHVKRELDYLVQSKVLIVYNDRIQLNKNYDQWRVSLVTCFNQDKFKKVIKRNLDDKTDPKTVTGYVSELPKQESDGYQNGNSVVTKTVTDISPNSSKDKEFEQPKETVKKSKESIAAIANDLTPEQQKAIKEVVEYWRDKQKAIYVSNADLSMINDLIVKKHISANTIIEVIEELYSRFEEQNQNKPWKKIKSIKYFVDRIFEVHHEKTNPRPINNVTPFRKQRRRPRKPDDLPTVLRPEYQNKIDHSPENDEELEKQKKIFQEKIRMLKNQAKREMTT
ncbi:MAG: replication protein [Thermoactinomyces sp.]